jgi:hypothetical protein
VLFCRLRAVLRRKSHGSASGTVRQPNRLHWILGKLDARSPFVEANILLADVLSWSATLQSQDLRGSSAT